MKTEVSDNGTVPKKRPHFSWPIYGRGVALFSIDCVLLAAVIALAFALVKCILKMVFGCWSLDMSLFRAHHWVKIVRFIVWPSCAFIVLLLFRNPLLQILYELPGFIRKSWCRVGGGGEGTPPGPGDKNVGDVDNDSEDNHTDADTNAKVATNGSEGTLPAATRVGTAGEDAGKREAPHVEVKEHAVRVFHYEHEILEQIQREYCATIVRERGIDGSRFYFDGIMDLGHVIFGIEIKHSDNPSVWEKILDRVLVMYRGFSNDCKKRFVFMACVCGKDTKATRLILERMAAEKPFRTVIRFFPISK